MSFGFLTIGDELLCFRLHLLVDWPQMCSINALIVATDTSQFQESFSRCGVSLESKQQGVCVLSRSSKMLQSWVIAAKAYTISTTELARVVSRL